jgi:hypothetical protein
MNHKKNKKEQKVYVETKELQIIPIQLNLLCSLVSSAVHKIPRYSFFKPLVCSLVASIMLMA